MLVEKIKSRQIWLNIVAQKLFARSTCPKSFEGAVDLEKCLRCKYFAGIRVGKLRIYLVCRYLTPNLKKSFLDQLVKPKTLRELLKLYNRTKYKMSKRW